VAEDNKGRQLRARLAALQRHHPDRVETITGLQYDLKMWGARRYIARLRAGSPALAPSDLEELAALLLPSVLEGGDHATTAG
jgi:hypothetical protein